MWLLILSSKCPLFRIKFFQNMAIAAESMGLGNLIIGCVYDALHGEKKSYFDKALAIPEGYSFQIALAVGHKTDNKTPHDYDESVQVSYL